MLSALAKMWATSAVYQEMEKEETMNVKRDRFGFGL